MVHESVEETSPPVEAPRHHFLPVSQMEKDQLGLQQEPHILHTVRGLTHGLHIRSIRRERQTQGNINKNG